MATNASTLSICVSPNWPLLYGCISCLLYHSFVPPFLLELRCLAFSEDTSFLRKRFITLSDHSFSRIEATLFVIYWSYLSAAKIVSCISSLFCFKEKYLQYMGRRAFEGLKIVFTFLIEDSLTKKLHIRRPGLKWLNWQDQIDKGVPNFRSVHNVQLVQHKSIGGPYRCLFICSYVYSS